MSALALLGCSAPDNPGSWAALTEENGQEGVRQPTKEELAIAEAIRRMNFQEPQYSESEQVRLASIYSYVDPTGIVPTRLKDPALAFYNANLDLIKTNRTFPSSISR